MSDELIKKKKDLRLKQKEIAQLEEEIRLLSLAEKTIKTPSLKKRFPVNSTVRLIGRNEKVYLKRELARVVDHTHCYVRLNWKKETFLRAPENIVLVKNVEQEKESSGSKGAKSDHSP